MKCIIHITSNVVLTDVSQTILHALEVELMYFKSIKIKASRKNFGGEYKLKRLLIT